MVLIFHLTCIQGMYYVHFGLLYQEAFNLILSWSHSFLWPIVGRYEASGGLKMCLHVFVSLFAIGCAWESMLEDGAQEVEPSCPTCLS